VKAPVDTRPDTSSGARADYPVSTRASRSCQAPCFSRSE
jgi:hypothetical protein